MRKLLIMSVFALALLLVAAVPAMASSGHTVSMTENQHGSWVETDVNPLTGDTIDVHFTGNQVDHVTYFPAGDEVWATFTETGSVWFVDNGVTYTGRATAWGGFNLNERNQNSTFTLTMRVTGSDGSVLYGHEVTHITYNGNGIVTVTFDKMSLTT